MAHENEYLDYTGLQTVANEIKARPKIWKGSLEDWEELSLEEKAKYDYVASDEEDDPITAATLPYDNTESGLVSTNVQGAIDEVVPFMRDIRKSPYVRLGLENGCPPGYLQLLGNKELKTVLIVGNSLTGCPLTYTSGGIEVTELREVGATRPNSGWTSLVRNYLKSLYPDVKVYKTNGAVWEQTGTLGNRSYNLIKDLTVWDITENGAFETELTVSDVLPQADIVTIELFENVGDCDTFDKTYTLAQDYNNLYASMKEVNPTAHYIQWAGFWYDGLKKAAVLQAQSESFFDVWTNENASIPSRVAQYYCGEAMQYGIGGEEIGNIPAAAATHPSDIYYYTMAVIWLFCMFNQSYKNGLPTYIPAGIGYNTPWDSVSVFNPPKNSGIDYNTEFGESTDPVHDGYRVLLPGNYNAGAHYYYDPFTHKNSTGYGNLKVTYNTGCYIQDFDAWWGSAKSSICNGFTITQNLLSFVGGDTPIVWKPKLCYRIFSLEADTDLNNARIYIPSGMEAVQNETLKFSFLLDGHIVTNLPTQTLGTDNYLLLETSIYTSDVLGCQRISDISGRIVERYHFYAGWSSWESIRV